MSAWQTWLHHPQRTALRKALFQIHLWVGVALAFYILVISASGTILVYRVELSRRFTREPVIVPGASARLTIDELKAAAQRVYPQYEVLQVTPRRNPNLPTEIVLRDGHKGIERLFNPFTGQDVGEAVTPEFRALMALVDFHDHLLSPPFGREVNGAGAVLTTLLCLSGLMIWWPGSKKWRSRLTINSKKDRNKLNWALHNVLGFWSVGFVLMWGVSGIYLCFPEIFNAVGDYLDPPRAHLRQMRWTDQFVSLLAKAHFGRFGGYPIKIVWTLFGILPIVLFATGMMMWWHRVLRPIWRRGLVARPSMKGVETQAAD